MFFIDKLKEFFCESRTVIILEYRFYDVFRYYVKANVAFT
jgi:hypothetical protein